MELFFEPFFPFTCKEKKGFKHSCIIGLGGNIGNVRKRFLRVLRGIKADRRFHVVQTSAILKNPPFGFEEQEDFYNAVMQVQTSLSPRDLLKFLLHTEKRFKRERSFKNAPRTLDLDIIFFDDIKYQHKRLKIPHPYWEERESVVIPLMFIKNL